MRLHLLIGQLDTPENRNRARLYVARALHREVRVREILSIQVTGGAAGNGRQLDVTASVVPVGQSRALQFGFPIFLEPEL